MTAAQLAALHRRRARDFDPSIRGATTEIADRVVEFSRARMQALIYAFPVPTAKSGKPLYKRTGDLKRGERAERTGPFSFKLTNTQPYAEPRHEAGKPGRRTVRHLAHWRDETVAAMRSLVLGGYADAVRGVFRKR